MHSYFHCKNVIIFLYFFVTAMQTASKSLMEAIADVYESQWTGADALNNQTLQIDALWQDFSHKLGDQVLIPLNTYTAQFPEMKVCQIIKCNEIQKSYNHMIMRFVLLFTFLS